MTAHTLNQVHEWVDQMKTSFDDKKAKLIFSSGNHDEDESESKQTQEDMEAWFPEAKGVGITDCWLSSRVVGNVYVISMDSQDMDVEFKRDQFNWVAAELQKAKQLRAAGTIDWVVALFHKPAFTLKSSHSPYTAVRFLYKDIFRDAQVDFCVHGHNHNTQLWLPMVPSDSEANGEGTQLFTRLPDGTFDFSKDHGWVGVVTGHAGHEWNAIDDSGAGVSNVLYFRDSGKFGYTVLETNGKSAKLLAKDTDNATAFEYPAITREGTVPPPPEPVECTDPTKCKDPATGECRPIKPNEHKSPTNGMCMPNVQPQPGQTICPRDYHYDQGLKKCIPDLEPQLNPVCPPGTKWNGTSCVSTGTGPVEPPPCPPGQHRNPTTGLCEPDIVVPPPPPPPCLQGECKDPITNQCRPIGPNEEKDSVTGFCKPKTTIPPPPEEGEVDSDGIIWYVAKGQKVVVAQSRDEATDDRWSENVDGCERGFEATFIGKSIGTSGDAHFAMKQGGSNHSGGGAADERWLDTGLRQDGTIQLQWEVTTSLKSRLQSTRFQILHKED